MGDSDLPTGPIDRARIARMIMAGLPELIGEAGCDLVGFSFGGAVAGLAAGIAPARIRSLTLVGSAGFGAPYNNPVLVKLRGLRGADRGAAHRINLERLMFADPARIDDLALEIQEQNTRRARLPSLNDRDLVMLPGGLGAFSGPCHAIWGEQDSFVSGHLDSRIERLRAARPGVDIELVPGVGHWVAYEAAERFGDYLRTRLQDLPGAASG
jgi:pimeloyl-ACP methyl ester carboxylesterase